MGGGMDGRTDVWMYRFPLFYRTLTPPVPSVAAAQKGESGDKEGRAGINTLKILSSFEGLKRASYRTSAMGTNIKISFLNTNLSLPGFCHSSVRLGKT